MPGRTLRFKAQRQPFQETRLSPDYPWGMPMLALLRRPMEGSC